MKTVESRIVSLARKLGVVRPRDLRDRNIPREYAQLRAFVRRARVRVDMQAARSLLPLLRQVSLAALGCGAQRATL